MMTGTKRKWIFVGIDIIVCFLLIWMKTIVKVLKMLGKCGEKIIFSHCELTSRGGKGILYKV